jgi:hypothetical protein
MMDMRLFAVYLGGKAPKANTELHDVVFVVGPSIEATYHRLMDKWFGDPLRLHIDSWMELGVVDGYRVTLRPEPPSGPERLYFINLGAYRPGEFTELHAIAFLVASDEQTVKERAKRDLLLGMDSVHKDDLYDVDDCLEVAEVDGQHIHLEATTETEPLVPNNGYHIIPPDVALAYVAARSV